VVLIVPQVVDGVEPNVTDLVPAAGTSYNVSATIEVAANVSDDVGVDTVLANVSYPNGSYEVLALGYVGGGMARAMIVAVIVTFVSFMFVDISIAHIGYVILTVVLTSTLFALGGLLNGVFGKTFDDISIVPTFVLTPLTYLGGVFYSVSLLPEFWQNVSMANPILYMVNGFRYGFLGQSDVGIATAMWVLIAFNVVFFSGAYYLLEKGKGIRS